MTESSLPPATSTAAAKGGDTPPGKPDRVRARFAGRALGRLIRVLRIAARHGVFGALRGRRRWPSPEHARLALEELGVVFVKFGQVLALRRDLLPPEYVEELERLHDRLPPEPLDTVRATIVSALGQPLEQVFSSFDVQPLAAASIAQVHAATLPDSRAVVVKVRRAGLAKRIADDIAALAYVAVLAERLSPRLRTLDLPGMVRELSQSLRREMDLPREGRTIHRFRDSLAADPNVWIPDVITEYTADAVLTLEHSPGERIDTYGERHPERKQALAAGVAALVLHQVFETGLFHADPHPGNLFVLPDGRLCLHDFGMVGELDERLREALVELLEAVVRSDARGAADAYLDIGLVDQAVDRVALERDLAALLGRIHERPIAEISVGDALESLLRLGGAHRVRNPGSLLLLARAFLIAEAVMRHLDPQMNVVELFGAELQRVAFSRFMPARLLAGSRFMARDFERMMREAPADLRRALRRVADGEIGRVRAPGVELIGGRLTRGIERLTGAVASGALLVTGGLLVLSGGWHRPVGDVLLAVGALGSILVAIGALRRGRDRVER